MAYLIDGNNLIGRAAPADLRDPAAREGWIRRLLAFQKFTRTRIVLVFDGRPPDDVPVVALAPKFTVVYTGPGGTADQAIEELVRERKDKRHQVVVSSDRRLRDFAREHGLAEMTSEAFLRRLKGVLRERRSAREMDKSERTPTSLEVSLWDDVFRKGR